MGLRHRDTNTLSTDSVYGWVGASPKCGVMHPEKDLGGNVSSRVSSLLTKGRSVDSGICTKAIWCLGLGTEQRVKEPLKSVYYGSPGRTAPVSLQGSLDIGNIKRGTDP